MTDSISIIQNHFLHELDEYVSSDINEKKTHKNLHHINR